MTITLFRKNDNWLAHFDGGQVRALFNRDTIPTGYKAHKDATGVKKAIQKRNPRATVVIKEGN